MRGALPLVVVWLGGCDVLFHLDGPANPDATRPVDDGRPPDAPPITFPGLLARYAMDEVMGDPTDGVVRDETGGGHDATCVSCPVVRAGVIGNALGFARPDDVLTIMPSVDFETPAAFSVAAWVFLDSPVAMTGGASGCVVVKRFNGDEGSWVLAQAADQHLLFISSSIGGPVTAQSNQPASLLAAWHHLVITWDIQFGLKRIVLDGEQAGLKIENPVLFDMGLLSIGASYDANLGNVDCHFPGAIDEVQIYDRALTDPEIGLLFLAGTP